MIDVRVLTGAALDAALDDVARLRITVFREWPYLYDGDLEYERDYLNAYRKSSDAVLIGAFDGTELIGVLRQGRQCWSMPMNLHPLFRG